MKKLLVLIFILIPAAVFATKDAASFTRSEVCPQLQSIAFSLTLLVVTNDRDRAKAIKNKDLKLADVYGDLRDISRKGAAEVSAIYETFCNEKWN